MRKLIKAFIKSAKFGVWLKRLFGANTALMIFASSFMPTTGQVSPSVEENLISKGRIIITTEVGIRYPVEKVELTQGYRFFHPGLDLNGETGDSIFPMYPGVVEFVEFSNIGYGNSIIVNHGNEVSTLYAHLSKIMVKKGDEVKTDTVLGLMGSTGHSTGSHLHFEIRDHNIPINPYLVLPQAK